ncbi:hypothetical protein FRC00_012061, partial [Tulasnella sp. 408]
ICSFLDAIELRCLALVDKTFWSILVSEKSDPIWRQTFKRVVPPMPECPGAMSGSDYAQFMLVKACTVSALEVISRQRPSALTDHMHDKICQVNGWASPDGSCVADFRVSSYGSKRQYLKVTVAEVYKLWKSMSETSNTLELANAQLILRLEKYRENRIKSGLKMKDWQVTAAEWNTAEVKRVVEERKTLILSKLLEIGYDEADFPRYCPEVFLTKSLDDEGWRSHNQAVMNGNKFDLA